jgi:hypothetical protein
MCRARVPLVRTVLWTLWLWLLGGCNEWVPQAKPVQPELLLQGSFRVDRILDERQRYVLVTRDPASETSQRRLLLERSTKKFCELPSGTVRVDDPLFDRARKKTDPLFMLPVIVRESDERDRELYYSDEHCNLRGPFGRSTQSDAVIPDQSQAAVSVVSDGRGTVSVVNPWTEEVRVLAEGVSRYRSVLRPASGRSSVQALWFIENGVLTQRALTGELILSRGENVRAFEQALYDTLRVAYVDGNELYEAAGPAFVPVLIAEDGCQPRYNGIHLNFFTPCQAQQLVRVDLTTGEPELFPPGMFWTYEQAGFLFEYFQEEGVLSMFVTPPTGERTQILEPLVEHVQVVDSRTIVGRTAEGDFRAWNANLGEVLLVRSAGRPRPFLDTRSSELLWLLPHDIQGRLGTLSLFSQRNLTQEVVARNVPTSGFSVEVIPQVSEPAIVVIEDAQTVSEDDTRLRGRLRAQLLSGELGAVIDEAVTSYASVYTPLPGLLYSVEDGPRSGLWFAAL